MIEVWLPILTLVLGYAGSLYTEAQRDRRLFERERRARDADREWQQGNRRADFQRETLLALQDALGRLTRSAAEIHHHIVMTSRRAGTWTRPLLGEEINQRNFAAVIDVNTFAVRVEDDELRRLVYKLREETTRVVLGEPEEEAERMMNRATDTFMHANARLGALLRSAY